MPVFNLGSINIDRVYALPHFPQPGETLSATQYSFGLGGKGLNQSVAAARAGADVFHIGAIGRDDSWVRTEIEGHGVDCAFVESLETSTGHAVIYVDAAAENSIVLDGGANQRIDVDAVHKALSKAASADSLLLQNETNAQVEAARIAHEKGMRVLYSAAPFDVESVKAVLPYVTVLLMNKVESEQLCAAFGSNLDQIPVQETLVTLGSKGAVWHSNETGETIEVSSHKVDPVDTTAAGDTFAGYFAAALDAGQSVSQAMTNASAAAALKVTRHGAVAGIPTQAEVGAFMAERSET